MNEVANAPALAGGQPGAVASPQITVAQVTLLLAIGLYARHVLLDAEGLLKFRAPKPKREKPAKKAKSEKSAARNDDRKPRNGGGLYQLAPCIVGDSAHDLKTCD